VAVGRSDNPETAAVIDSAANARSVGILSEVVAVSALPGKMESTSAPPESRVYPMHEVTRILSAIEQGDGQAAEQLLPLVYDELRRVAAERMAQEKPGQTLQATGLVHEAYIRLVDVEKAQHWDSRGHFFAAAAEAMRRILVEQARRKGSLAAGGKHQRVEMSDVDPEIQRPELDLVALSQALDKLAAKDPRSAELVKLRFFAGMTRQEAAQTLGVSLSTADTDWAYAKCWLQFELSGSAGAE
jgi:RNA polymerase sigma factor (TIGR02999 family)